MISLCLSFCLCTVLPLQLKNSNINEAQIWWAGISWGTDKFFQILCNFIINLNNKVRRELFLYLIGHIQ